jgi:hypothetical protein
MVSLNATKARYVLLNFWQGADDINNKLFPALNALFKKYRSKSFSIYNVYIGKSEQEWRNTIHFEEIGDWVNVADAEYPNSQSRNLYNVVSVPANYLLDLKEKDILAKDINPYQLGEFLSQTIQQ